MVAVISLCGITACGGHHTSGPSPYPARITLSPVGNTSVQLGNTFNFTASALNGNGGAVGATFTFASSDTSVLNIAPNGVACAGHWDAAFTTCTPGGAGVAQVTASALGTTSPPTFVFVHPPIDHITVSGVLLNGLPIQEPCLSQSQTMTVEAHAFSQGSDITASVGPFTWSAKDFAVVTLTPLVNIAYNFPTNQATAKAATPGLTQIYASASGVSSTSFQQPPPGTNLNFFETCPIQNITLELNHAGSGQTSFVSAKGASQTVIATVTDVMGNSSLPNANGGIVLSKIPLIWSASKPAVVSTATGCTESCTISTPLAGAGSVTASCAPPTCNIGFPQTPSGISAPFIPLPVYATTAISGVATGAASPSSILATSTSCAHTPPATCDTAIYSISTTAARTGNENPMPNSPNSMLFDLAGVKAYLGSDFGAQSMNPANLNTNTGAFTSLGTVTGKVLAVSANGSLAVFSDTLHTPNQVLIVNTANATSTSITPLNISGAVTAAFSPDGLKTFIFGFDSAGNPNLYIYSTVQALQTIPLPPGTTVNSIAFSTNGAFAYVVEPNLGSTGPAVSVFNTCDNRLFTDTLTGLNYIPLSSPPLAFKALPDGVHFAALENGGTIQYITAKITGIPPATLAQPATSICPMLVGHEPLQTIDLGQGDIHPIDFFVSGDSTQLYIAASDRSSILVYDFNTGAVTGIELAGNATPVSVDMTADASTLVVAGSDGMLHEVSTALGGSDMVQLAFSNLPNFLNPFCNFDPAQGPCTFNLVAAKP